MTENLKNLEENKKIETENIKKKIKKLSDEIKQISLFGKIQNKSVNFENDNFDKINNYNRYNGRVVVMRRKQIIKDTNETI